MLFGCLCLWMYSSVFWYMVLYMWLIPFFFAAYTEDNKKKEFNNIKHTAKMNGYSGKTIEKLNWKIKQNPRKENIENETMDINYYNRDLFFMPRKSWIPLFCSKTIHRIAHGYPLGSFCNKEWSCVYIRIEYILYSMAPFTRESHTYPVIKHIFCNK